MRAPIWIDDATILATAEDRGETHLYRIAADGSQAPVPLSKGALSVQTFHAAGSTIAMVQSTVEHPGELVTHEGSTLPVATALTRSWSGWERFAVPCDRRIRRDRRLDHAAGRVRRRRSATRCC